MPDEQAALLVVCAHPDDECIGAGGTILTHTTQGVPVDVLCLTGNDLRNDELKNACSRLGVRSLFLSERDDFAIDMDLVNEVIGAILKSRPSAIITHSDDDYNHNHRNTAEIVDRAVEWASHTTVFDNAHRVPRIYHMEINTTLSKPQVFVNITQFYQNAVAALREHKSQVGKANDYYLKLYDARTALRGVQSACGRAEAFSVTLPTHAGPFYPTNNVSSLV